MSVTAKDTPSGAAQLTALLCVAAQVRLMVTLFTWSPDLVLQCVLTTCCSSMCMPTRVNLIR